MTIRWKIAIISISLVVLTAILTTGISVYNIRQSAQGEIAEFRKEEIRKVEENLRNMVELAWTVAKTNHEQSRDKEYLEKIYGKRLRDMIGISYELVKRNHDNAHDRTHLEQYYGLQLQEVIEIIESILARKQRLVERHMLTPKKARQQALEEIKEIRFNSTGYAWVTDNRLPFPKMLMHPMIPALNGKVLNDPKFNCALGKKRNLFQVMAEVCRDQGEGFIDYEWPKPTSPGKVSKELVPKLSYVKLYKPWGWIIGTGVYIDDAVLAARQRTLEEVKNLQYDSGTGYFWINDNTLPYPRMIMHPQNPDLDGKVLDLAKFNCALGKQQNLFQAMVEICREKGEGFVDYQWPKPGNNQAEVAKLSYVKIFEPWGWVIGTGIYLDDADRDAQQKSINEICKLRYEPDGYFWINDLTSPVPKMLMHPILPELDGKILDNPKFDCADGEKKNLFQVMAEVCQSKGQGLVDYQWSKPLPDGRPGKVEPKLSFVKIFQPWNWVIGSGVYVDHIYREINRKEQEMLARERQLALQILIFSLLAIIIGVIGSEIAANTLSRPLLTMIETMKKVDLESIDSTSLNLTGSREIHELGNIFNRMLVSLHQAIVNLGETTRDKEKIESELNIARDIQMSIIPKLFPAYPDREEFDLYAIIDTAREVGGDLYDFFFLDDNHLVVAVGDVSGKGVPASLFMAVTQTLLRAKSDVKNKSGKTVTEMNKVLCADNEMMMFVTFFTGILNIKSGQFQFTNAGHNPPYLIKKDEIEVLEDRHGTALGVMEGQEFSLNKIKLKPGNKIVMFTDGVTEAVDINGAFFGEKRLEELLQKYYDADAKTITKAIFEALKDFIGEAQQADDITLLVLEYHGKKK